MATTVYTNNQYYTDIADAIRNKNKSSIQYKPSEMAPAINALIVSGSAPSLQAKSIDPTTSSQVVTYDSSYNGLSQVTVSAISPIKTVNDLTVSGATVTVPKGWYDSNISKSIATGSAGTPTASKGTISNNSITVTPSVTNTTGYITGGTKTGTAVTIRASELVSDTLSITSNGTKDVTNYANVDVNVPIGSTINNQNKTVTPSAVQQNITFDSGYTGLGTVTVNAIEENVFYVYCTSNCDVYKIPILDIENWTFDITSLVHDGYLYGGYYSSVGGTPSQAFTAADLKTKTFVNGIWNDAEGTPYTGSKATAFKRVNAYTNNGTAITPTADTIYYLKEVPNDYLRTLIVPATPEEGEETSSNIYILTSCDDANFGEVGFISHELLSITKLSAKITIQDISYTAKNNMSGQVYPDKTINLPRGYMISYDQDISSFNNNSLLSYSPYWKTIDEVYVTNKFTTTVNIGNHTVETVSISYSSHLYPAISTDISAIVQNDNVNVISSNNSVTIPSGYYPASLNTTIADGLIANPVAIKGTVSNNSISITPSVTVSTGGYIAATTKTGTAITVSANELVSGNKAITTNGTNIDVTNYKTISVNVPSSGSTISNQDKDVTPTEEMQQITADSGYTGLGTVNVGAISSTYVGSGVARRSSSNLTTSGATVTVPAGYYEAAASKSVATMTLPASAATSSSGTKKLEITPTTSARYINIPTGYNGTASYYQINAIPSNYIIPSGDKEITANGTGIDVKNYATVSVAVPATSPNLQAKTGINPLTSSQTITADSGYDGLESVQINAMTAMTLPTAASSSATSGFTSKATIGRSTSDQYINIPTGYNSVGGYYKISAVANGSATAPASISGTTATVSTGTNTLTLTKTVSVTPSVTAGYISSGTAGNSSVSLTASVTTKAATTYNASTSDQTIAAGTYLTGAQTIRAIAHTATAAKIAAGQTITIGDSGSATRIANISGTFTSDATATAADIVSGETAYVNGSEVTGSLVINKYYTGSSAPSSSLGINGDIYIQQ